MRTVYLYEFINIKRYAESHNHRLSAIRNCIFEPDPMLYMYVKDIDI